MALSGMSGWRGAMAVGDLRQGQAAALLDGLDAERAVAVAAREHHPGRQLARSKGP